MILPTVKGGKTALTAGNLSHALREPRRRPVEVGFVASFRHRQLRRQIRFCQRLHAGADVIANVEGDDPELLQRFPVAVEQIDAQRQLGFSIQPGDKAVARAVASHDADHVAEAVSDTGTAHGDKIIRRGEAFEIAIYQRWQRIDDIVAVQGERIETGFKIADFRAAQTTSRRDRPAAATAPAVGCSVARDDSAATQRLVC